MAVRASRLNGKIERGKLLKESIHGCYTSRRCFPRSILPSESSIKAFPVNINGLVGGSSSRDVPEMPPPDEHARLQADAAAAKREALTGIGHCIFSKRAEPSAGRRECLSL